MPFEFCCFVSYPHGQDEEIVPIVKDFVVGLKKEVGWLLRQSIYTDEFLNGGQRINETIGPSICKSACMIVFYTPLYFDEEHTYCAREFRAMELLEQERLKHLRNKGDGLIITVVLRGAEELPKVLADRKYYRFDQILANKPGDIREMFAEDFKKMAYYIYERCKSLKEAEEALKHDCDTFCLPSEEDARNYVNTIFNHDLFPGGKNLAAANSEG